VKGDAGDAGGVVHTVHSVDTSRSGYFTGVTCDLQVIYKKYNIKSSCIVLLFQSGILYHMSKTMHVKRENTLIGTIEKKYGVKLNYLSDSQLHAHLKKDGLPSLSKLLKIVHKQ
jgi:hypothetical protein